MHISESEFLRNALQHPFQHLRTSCLETGMAAIPLVIPNLYSVKRIISWCSKVRRVYHLEQKLLHKNHCVYRQNLWCHQHTDYHV